MCWTLWLHKAHATGLSHRILSTNHQHAFMYLQGRCFAPAVSVFVTYNQSCARCLLPPTERAGYLKRFRRPGLEGLQRSHLSKAVLSSCKKRAQCPWCGAANGTVKRSGTMKISHEPFRATKNAMAKEEYLSGFGTAIAENKAISQHLSRAVEDLNPLKVLELFKRVSAEDAELLSLHPDIGRPEDYIWQYISVPPPCIRPSVASEAGK